MAAWDVESRGALLSNRSTAILHVLAHQEAASVKVFELFVDQRLTTKSPIPQRLDVCDRYSMTHRQHVQNY